MTAKVGNIIVGETKQVALSTLKTFHKNPRVGDIDAIAKSLHFHGQFRPIIVNKGGKTGRKNEIVAGNHTYLAARKELVWTEGDQEFRKEAWTHLVASHIDVDDETAKRIVLADNKTAELGTYDDALLAELLAELPDIHGLGYDQSEVDELMSTLQSDIDNTLGEAPQPSSGPNADDLLSNVMPQQHEDPRQQHIAERSEERKEALSRRGVSIQDFQQDRDVQELGADRDATAELQAVLEAREENIYKGKGPWGIPELSPDRLQGWPGNVITWAGDQGTPDDGSSTYLVNYSLGGLRGLPFDRALLSFFTYDTKFANWWEMPAYYTAKYMAKGVKMAMVPDFSFYYTETRAHHMWNVYRAQWLGRFFQDAGMRVMPRLQFDYTDPHTLDIALQGIPRNAPCLAISMQNVEDEKKYGPNITAIAKEAFAELQPQHVLLYGGNPGRRVIEATGYTDGEIHFVLNYAGVRRATGVFGNQEGLGALKKRDADAKRAQAGVKPKRQEGTESEDWDDD